jgi:predicted RNA-binding Zn ribbon-like protein
MGELNITPGGWALLGGRLCLDFCNTIERHTPPRDFLTKERYDSFLFWGTETTLIPLDLAEHYTAWASAHPQAAQTLFEQAIELREAIYQIGLATIAGAALPVDSVAILDHWVQQAANARQLYATSNQKLDWQWRSENAPERPLWEIALSAVDVFLKEDLTRLRQCPGCGWLFYDQTKNNTRTWCDMRFCGNRAKNKRFHARQKQASE